MRIITKEHAVKIAKKLNAAISSRGGAHDLAAIYEEGQLIAQFGIRRGSEKDKGHDHISGDLHLGPHKTKLLAECTFTRDQWLNEMRERGLLPPPRSRTET